MDLITQFIISILHREANMMLAKHCTIFHFTAKEMHCTCDIILYNNPFIREPYKEIQFKVVFSQRKTPRVWLSTSPSLQCFIKLWTQINFYHQAKVSHLGVGWNKDISLEPCIRTYLVFSPEKKIKNCFLQAGHLQILVFNHSCFTGQTGGESCLTEALQRAKSVKYLLATVGQHPYFPLWLYFLRILSLT